MATAQLEEGEWANKDKGQDRGQREGYVSRVVWREWSKKKVKGWVA